MGFWNASAFASALTSAFALTTALIVVFCVAEVLGNRSFLFLQTFRLDCYLLELLRTIFFLLTLPLLQNRLQPIHLSPKLLINPLKYLNLPLKPLHPISPNPNFLLQPPNLFPHIFPFLPFLI